MYYNGSIRVIGNKLTKFTFQGSVQQLFVADQSARSIKSQVCDVVQTIVTTVHQIYSVFYCDGNMKPTDNKCNGKVSSVYIKHDQQHSSGKSMQALCNFTLPFCLCLPSNRRNRQTHASDIECSQLPVAGRLKETIYSIVSCYLRSESPIFLPKGFFLQCQ